MAILIGLIVLNVLLLLIFDLFKKNNVDTFQAIVFNYITTVITGTIVLGRFPIRADTWQEPYFPYAIILGILFISGFTILGYTVKAYGVTLTSIAQKMSLIMPILFGLFFFKEDINFLKWVGILFAIFAIVLINFPNKEKLSDTTTLITKSYLIILTFILSGIIDTLLYYVEKSNLSQEADIGFVVTLFGMAGTVGSIILIVGLISGRLKWQLKNVFFGVLLGIPNFFTIYGLLLLINNGYDSNFIFPILNVSIIALAAITGAVFLKEKLTKLQWIGFVMGLLCITFIAIS